MFGYDGGFFCSMLNGSSPLRLGAEDCGGSPIRRAY